MSLFNFGYGLMTSDPENEKKLENERKFKSCIFNPNSSSDCKNMVDWNPDISKQCKDDLKKQIWPSKKENRCDDEIINYLNNTYTYGDEIVCMTLPKSRACSTTTLSTLCSKKCQN